VCYLVLNRFQPVDGEINENFFFFDIMNVPRHGIQVQITKTT
jgi:hypothetical protein